MLLQPDEVKVAPSILSADFGELAAESEKVRGATDWLHLDVMDAHFVDNLTLGPPVVASLRRHCDAYFDCHLMMDEPGRYLEAFKRAGADLATVHVEVGDTASLLSKLSSLDLGVGLALNPDTPVSAVEPFLERIDLLLVMSVFPGFGGQAFMTEVVTKVEALAATIEHRGLPVVIEVDGGIDEETAPVMARAGARVFVAGSAVFGHEDPAARVRVLHDAAVLALGPRAGPSPGCP